MENLTNIDRLIKEAIVDYVNGLCIQDQEPIREDNEGKFNFGSIYVEFTLESYKADWNFDLSYQKYEFVIEPKNIYYTFENQ